MYDRCIRETGRREGREEEVEAGGGINVVWKGEKRRGGGEKKNKKIEIWRDKRVNVKRKRRSEDNRDVRKENDKMERKL